MPVSVVLFSLMAWTYELIVQQVEQPADQHQQLAARIVTR